MPDTELKLGAAGQSAVQADEEHPPHDVHSSGGCELWIAFFRDRPGGMMATIDERGSRTG